MTSKAVNKFPNKATPAAAPKSNYNPNFYKCFANFNDVVLPNQVNSKPSVSAVKKVIYNCINVINKIVKTGRSQQQRFKSEYNNF